MMQRPMLVTAAVILKDGRILIAQRLPDSRFEPSKWEFPGGKVDFGEHPEEALKRELREELGIDIEVGALYHLASHVYFRNGLERHVVILFYLCKITNGTPAPLDCQDLKWTSRSELPDNIFVEGDNEMVSTVIEDDELWFRM
ncbi:MAG: (deoxy)nucleoside triphosphate pyrophosphohydrolase [Thermoplasmatota archaeon]